MTRVLELEYKKLSLDRYIDTEQSTYQFVFLDFVINGTGSYLLFILSTK